MTKVGGEKPAFSYVGGRFHGPESADLLKTALAQKGRILFAPDLPIEDGDVSLDDHAQKLSKAELDSGFDEIVRVGWSWGANVVLREFNDTTKKIILISAGLHPSTIQNHPNGASIMHIEHGLMYEIYQNLDDGLKKQFARDVFYHDVRSDDIVQAAIESLREHPRREEEPTLEQFPAKPLGYIALLEDRVNKLEYQWATALALGVRPDAMVSGHAPMYSKPRYLAARLISLASQPTDQL